MRALTVLLGIPLLLLSTISAGADKLAEKYAALPIMESLSLSPDGNHIAAIYNAEQGPQVVLMPFPSLEFTPLVQLKKAKDRIENIYWSGNERLIVETSYPEYYNGKFMRVQRLYSLNLKTNKVTELVNQRFKKQSYYNYQAYYLISALKNDHQYALISTYDYLDGGQSVFKVDLDDGSFEKVLVNKYEIDRWFTDAKGRVRLGVQTEALKASNEFKTTFWYRLDDQSEMKPLHSRINGKDETFSVVGITETGDKAYVMSDYQTRRQSLWLYDLQSNQFESMVYGHDIYDLSSARMNSEGELIGVNYIDDFVRIHYFDEADALLDKDIQKLLPGKQSHIVSKSADSKRMLVWGQSDTQVPIFYYVDLRSNKAGVWLAQYPTLVKDHLSPVQAIEYSATDGQKINGYLTLPQGAKNPPLIVHPHGGPTSRDSKYFDPMVQFLASKGYAVLQVNFRGSEGFGSDFEVAGYQQWGKTMQQDVYDAMDYVINNFPVSKDKACLVGASYGGYVALTAAFQQPERFDCIVSIAGISDLKELVTDSKRWGFDISTIIDPADDEAKEKLKDVSAIYHTDKIKAPILLIHGTQDTQVHYDQSADFANKGKKLDLDYVEIKGATHYFDDKESRYILFSKVGKFLDNHL